MATVIDRHALEAQKRGGKRWQVLWRDEQRKQRRRAFERKVDAERFCARVEHELNTGTYQDPRAGNIPFDEYAGTWFASQLHLRPATRLLYGGLLRNHLVPFFGHTPLNQVTVDLGRRYLAAAERSTTVNRKSFMMLRRILNDAVSERLIPYNSLQSLKLPKEQQKEANFLTIDQLHTVVSHTHPHFQTLVLAAGFLGLRQGELFGLHPANLDLDARQVRVVEQLSKHVEPPQREELKTKTSRRTVSIPTFLIADLEEQLRTRSSDDYVFTSTDGEPIRASNFNRRQWDPARKAAGFPELKFHELRHTAATIAIQSGAHPKAIQSRLGHSSITVTLDRYGHLMPGTDLDLADGIDKLIAAQQPLSRDVIPHPSSGVA
jgi:integrase